MTDLLVWTGGALKALGGGRLAGLLVPYGDEATADLDDEFFTKATDFDRDLPGTLSVYYNHGLDATIGKRRLARGTVKAEEAGVWFETQLDLADAYQARIYRLAEAGKLGLSSGSAPHLVEKRPAGKSVEITRWPLVEASLTPTPANPAARAYALKAWEELTPTLAGLEAGLKGVERLSVSDHAASVERLLDAAADYVERMEARGEFRLKMGRMFSGANTEEMAAIYGRLGALLAKAGWRPAGDETGPGMGSVPAKAGGSVDITGHADGGSAALREAARFEALAARLAGVPVEA